MIVRFKNMRVLLPCAVLVISCTSAVGPAYQVELSEVWNLGLYVGGPSKTIATTGVVSGVDSDADSCRAELTDGNTRVGLAGRGSVCQQLRSANGRRVRVEGSAAMGCREPDSSLVSADGGGPFVVIDATRLNPEVARASTR